jgi:16S rRNA G966 N2-methylase RsmD
MEDIYEKCYKLIAHIPTQKCELIAIEHMSGISLPESIGDYKIKKSKKFGKTTITYLE